MHDARIDDSLPTIYFAAALFCARETTFNLHLADKLAQIGFTIILPQRDGFEFSKLSIELAKHMTELEAATALQSIIYLLDIGFFVHKSDVVLANFDEPLDPGVDIEVTWGKMLHKLVIGYRTDVRSPYGVGTPLGGMHFFPAFQCNIFISSEILAKNITESDKCIHILAEKIQAAIRMHKVNTDVTHELSVTTVETCACAQLLFGDIVDIHNDIGVGEIVKRYLTHEDRIKALMPQCI